MIEVDKRQSFLSGVSVLDEVQYLTPVIGHIPLLAEIPILQGFSWGIESANMAYRQHNGDPTVITERNENFLCSLGMESLKHAVVMEATIGIPDDNIVPINVDYQFLAETHQTRRGIFTSSHLAFTRLSNQPIVIKPGDCAVALIGAKSSFGENVVGVIHSSRNELARKLPILAIRYLEEVYDCNPSQIKAGIIPSLGSQNHTIMETDVERCIQDFASWDHFQTTEEDGTVHLNVPTYFVDQLIEAGMYPENIQIYDIDTYDAAAKGESFSYRYTTKNKFQRPGRFMVAIQVV